MIKSYVKDDNSMITLSREGMSDCTFLTAPLDNRQRHQVPTLWVVVNNTENIKNNYNGCQVSIHGDIINNRELDRYIILDTIDEHKRLTKI